ncbi:hypothetical protein FDECE_9888 [Fusarium decemcellulare]|nr:hypothetical protein FDECE_9888 [Fusarium decemcellulare]
MSDSEVNIGYRVFPLTHRIHKEEYPAVSPSRPALSQAGKTVLITGGSSGIGFEIARDFGRAGAERVITIGRDQAKVDQAAEQLTRESDESSTTFEGRSCQIADSDSIDKLWDNLDAEGIRVDVLVLNAAMTDQFGKMESLGWRNVWKAFETNVRSYHQFCDRLQGNAPIPRKKKYIVSVSTSAIHDFPAASYAPSYSLTKNSATLLLQQLAREFPSTDTQIVSFHPGAIFTQGAKGLGADETTLPWDDGARQVNLPASVAVWAASDEAAFLHGRFIWAPWDVEELGSGELRELLDKDEKFLRIGVHGLEDPATLKRSYVQ